MPAKGETCTELIRLNNGETYEAFDECYVITEDHSISDVVQWCIGQADANEIKYLVDLEDKSALEKELESIDARRKEILDKLAEK